MIKIKNEHLNNVADFLLNSVGAKGKKSIHKMRVVKALQEKHKEVSEEEVALLKEYAGEDEEGNIKRNDAGQFDIKDTKGFNEAHKALFDEEFVIDDVNLESALKTVEKLINDYDKELSGKQAEAHFVLYEAFEEAKGEDEE
jgi:ribosomal protein S7